MASAGAVGLASSRALARLLLVVAGLAVLLPLLPFLLLGGLVWSFMKRPAVSA